MSTLSIILCVLAFDGISGYILKLYLKKQKRREQDLFLFKFESIMSNSSKDVKERIEHAKTLCRDTDLHVSTGAYYALLQMENIMKLH